MAISYDRLCEIWNEELRLRLSDRKSWESKFKEAIGGNFSQYTEEEREAWDISMGIKEPPRHPNDEISEAELLALFFIELPDKPLGRNGKEKWMREGRKWVASRLTEYAIYLQEEENADKWTVKRLTENPYASDVYHAVEFYHMKEIMGQSPEEVERMLMAMHPKEIIARFECNRDYEYAKRDPDEKVWRDVARDMEFERECDLEIEPLCDVSKKTREDAQLNDNGCSVDDNKKREDSSCATSVPEHSETREQFDGSIEKENPANAIIDDKEDVSWLR